MKFWRSLFLGACLCAVGLAGFPSLARQAALVPPGSVPEVPPTYLQTGDFRPNFKGNVNSTGSPALFADPGEPAGKASSEEGPVLPEEPGVSLFEETAVDPVPEPGFPWPAVLGFLSLIAVGILCLTWLSHPRR